MKAMKKGNLYCLLLLFLLMPFIGFAQTETEPNDVATDAGVQYFYQAPSTISGTVSSTDKDLWFVARDPNFNDGHGQTIIHNNVNSPANPGIIMRRIYRNGSYTASPDARNQPITDSPGNVDVNGSGSISYGLIEISTTNATPTAYSITIEDHNFAPSLKLPDFPACPGPAATANTSLSTIADNSIRINSFNAATDADGYIVKINAANTFTDLAEDWLGLNALGAANATYSGGEQVVSIDASTSPAVDVTGLDANTTYYTKVYPYRECNGYFLADNAAATASATTCAARPVAVSGIVSSIGSTSIDITSYTAPAGAAGYVIKINDADNSTTPTTLPTADPAYGGTGDQVVYTGTSASPAVTITGLTPGTDYYVSVYPYNVCNGNNLFESTGATVTLSTPCGVTTNLASNILTGEVGDSFIQIVSFDLPVGGATGYVVKMNEVNSITPPTDGPSLPTFDKAYAGGEQVIHVGTEGYDVYTVTGLSTSTTYHFTIYAYEICTGVYTYQSTGYNFSVLNVKPLPTINFSDITKAFGDPSFALNATSNSTGTILYEIVSQTNVGNPTTGGSFITLGGTGTVVIKAAQEADANFNPGSKEITLTIEKADPVITWTDPADIASGTALDGTQLNATAAVPGAFSYTYEFNSGGAMPITSGVTTLITEGIYTLTTSFTPTDTESYNTVSSTVNLSITPIVLTDQTVSATPLTGTGSTDITVSLAGSQLGASYYLRNDADNAILQGPLTGTGSGINFPVDVALSDRTYNVLATPVAAPVPVNLPLARLTSFEFDDVNGYVSVPSTINSQLTNQITVETWAYIPSSDDTDSEPGLLSQEYDGSTLTYALSIDQGTMFTGFFRDGGWRWINNISYPKDQWFHVASTYDGNTIRLYFNGVEQASQVETIGLPLTNTLNWRMGKSHINSANPSAAFGGSMAETRVWNVARTVGEISSNMNVTLSGPESNLIAHYNYNATSGTTVADQSGTGLDGTIVNMPGDATNWKVNGLQMSVKPAVAITQTPALHFNGSASIDNLDYDYIEVADNGSLDFTTNFTFETWVNIDVLDKSDPGYDWHCLFAKSRFNDFFGLMLKRVNSGGSYNLNLWHAGIGGAAQETSYNWNLSANTWYHVGVTMNGTNISFFIDGVEVVTRAVSGSLVPNDKPLRIGAGTRADGTGMNDFDPYPLDGALDEVRMWNTARTITEINDNMNTQLSGSEAGLVLYYNFNEGVANADNSAVTSVTDFSGSGNNATLNGFQLTGSAGNYVGAAGNGVTGKAAQVITFDALENKTYGDAVFSLTTSTTSGLPLTYSSSNTNVATVATDGMVTIVGAGMADITVSQVGDADYFARSKVQSLTVDKVALTLETTVFSKIYGETDPAFGHAVISGALIGLDAITGDLGRDVGENVGEYAFNPGDITAGDNYNITVEGNFIIDPKELTVTADDKSIEYGVDQNAGHTATYAGFITGENEADLTGTLTFANITETSLGTYSGVIIPSGLTSNNYDISFVGGELIIAPKGLTVTASDKTIQYGEDQNAGHAVTYSGFITGETESVLGGTLAFANISVDAGSNIGVIMPSGLTSTNYNISYVNGDLTIGQKDLTITGVDRSIEYGQDPDVGNTVTYSGFITGEDENDLSGILGFGEAPSTDVGTYLGVLSPSGLTSTNYNISFVFGDLTITQKGLTVTAEDQIITYGDDQNAGHTVTYTGFVFGENEGDLTGTLGFANITQTDAGTYSGVIIPSGLTNSNYTISYTNGNLTISQKPLTISVDGDQGKDYGDTDPELTFESNVALVGTDAFSGALTRIDAGGAIDDIGSYAITIGTLQVGGNGGNNYDITFNSPFPFEILKRGLRIEANDQAKTVGNSDPALTYAITQGSLVGSDMVSGELTRVAGESVGSYFINQGTLSVSNNYDLTFNGANLTITDKIVQTISFGMLVEKTYGESSFDLSATGGASGNAVTFVSSDENIATVSGNTVTIVGAGMINITASQAGDVLHEAAADVVRSLTVNAKSIGITADANQSKVYGLSDPVFTYAVTGNLEAGDTFTGSLSRGEGENVGIHAINQGTLSAGGNYTITFNSANFEITQKPLTVTADAGQSKAYGASDPVFAYTLTGSLEAGDAFNGSLSRGEGETVGTYTVNQGTLSAGGNYNITFNGANFEITQKPLTVTADAGQSKAYGSPDPVFAYTLTGVLETGDTFTGSMSRGEGENVGIHVINQGTLSAGGNYNITFEPNDFEITQKPLTVTVDASQSKVFGGADPTFTYTLAGTLETGDSFSGTLDRATGENVGIYAIGQGTLTAGGNYVITYNEDNFEITKATQTITFNPLNAVSLNDADFSLGATATSGLAVTYVSSNPAVATVTSGGTVSIVGLGTTNITASQAGDGNWNAAGDVMESLTVNNLLAQTITFNALTNKTYGDAAFSLTATGGGSANAVTYESSNTAVATVSGSTVTIIGVGSTNITASQAGTASYNPATDVMQSLTVDRATLTATADDQSKIYNTANPALTISYSGFVNGENESVITAPSIATTAVKASIAGTYPISLTGGAGGSNYTLVKVDGTLTISHATQTITFDAIPAKKVGDAPFTLTATASSELAIIFSSSDEAIASIQGSEVTIHGSGTVTITASQAGDASFNPATSTQELVIAQVTAIGDMLKSVKLYPIPFTRDFNLVLPEGSQGDYHLIITNIEGRMLVNKELKGHVLTHRIDDLKSVPEGIYNVQLGIGNSYSNYRIIKQ